MIDVLEAGSGIVCLVGAGGKKSLLYHLAAIHPGRVGVTATVHIPFFPVTLQAMEVIADPSMDLVAEVVAARGRRVAFAREPGKRGRWSGVDRELVEQVHRSAGFDVTLVKADGARGLRLKAPGADEPCIPAAADTVIPVASAAVLGRALDPKVVHRPEAVCALTGLQPGEIVRPRHLAELMVSDSGALKGVGGARVVPVLNMVDDAKTESLARETAERALELSSRLQRVVLTCMQRRIPMVAVVER